MIAELKRNIDLAHVVSESGVELKSRGTRHVGLCPLHNEKTPSFFVFNNQRFRCFGCGAHGDAIDFVQRLYGLSFPDALKHLGISQGEITPEVKRNIEKRELKKQKADADKQFKADLCYTLSLLIAATYKAAKEIKTIDDFEKYGEVLQPLPFWEYNLELLHFGSRQDRQEDCQELRAMEVIPVKGLFKSEFNYRKWLNKFNENGEQENVERITVSFN